MVDLDDAIVARLESHGERFEVLLDGCGKGLEGELERLPVGHPVAVRFLEDLHRHGAPAPDAARLVRHERAGRVGLEQVDAQVVGPRHEQGGAEGPGPSVLGEVLLIVADLLGQHLHADVLPVVDAVDLGLFPRLVDEDPGIRDQAGGRAADVIVDVVDLLDGIGLH